MALYDKTQTAFVKTQALLFFYLIRGLWFFSQKINH